MLDSHVGLLTFKIFATALFGAVAYYFSQTLRYGRRMALIDVGRFWLGEHKRHLAGTFCTLLSALAVVILVQTMIGHTPHSYVFPIHEAFDVGLCGLLLAMYFRYTGERAPRVHGRVKAHALLAYAALVCFVGALDTGLWLLWTDVPS